MSHRLPTGADYNMNGHVCLPSTPTRVLIEGLLVIGNKIRLTIDILDTLCMHRVI